MNDERLFTSHDVARICGVTYRQVDYWVRIGLVHPYTEARGSGTRRQFTADDIIQVRRIKLASTLNSCRLSDCLDRLDDLLAELSEPIPA